MKRVACFLIATACALVAHGQQFSCVAPGAQSITCTPTSSPPVPPPISQTFSLSGPAALTVSAPGSITVSRSGGTAGAYSMSLTTAGNCSGSGTVAFANGASSAPAVPITAGGNPSSFYNPPLPCTATLGALQPQSGATLGAPLSFTVNTAGPSQTCPPPPVPLSNITLNNGGEAGPWTIINLPSGQVGTFPLPNVNPGYNAGIFHYGSYSQSPSGSLIVEITISKCKGEINPAAGACYLHTTFADYQSISWVGIPTSLDPTTWGYCNAQQSQGPWYLNMRYTYQTCNYPPACGFQWAWYNSQLTATSARKRGT